MKRDEAKTPQPIDGMFPKNALEGAILFLEREGERVEKLIREWKARDLPTLVDEAEPSAAIMFALADTLRRVEPKDEEETDA